MSDIPVETFPALESFAFCRHAFINRIPNLNVQVDRELALQRLAQYHDEARQRMGFAPMITCRQIHEDIVTVVDIQTRGTVEGADGLVTNQPGLSLSIYVADCCAVYLLDPVCRCIGLVHSGRRGTELGIARETIEKMRATFGANPRDMIVQLSPCIRPPFYETDFAAEIVQQCRAAGVEAVHDCGTCTAADLERYYSYRAESGKTGRMLALFELTDAILEG